MSRTGDLAFVPEDTPEGEGFEALPRGDYPAQIIDAKVEVNKNQNGRNLVLEFLIDGKRKLREWLAVDNPGAKAQEIARGNLAKISRVSGLTGVPSVAAKLIGRKLNLRLDVEETTNLEGKKYMNNVIKGYKEYSAAATVAPVVPTKVEEGNKPEVPFDDDDIPF